MKKIKLLAPLLTVAALGSSTVALASCSNSKLQVHLLTNEGGTLEGETKDFEVAKGTKWGDITKPTPKAKSGYEFIGWYRGENKITDSTVIETSMDVYAWFTLVSPQQNYVTVIASPGGKIATGGSTTIVPVSSEGSIWKEVMPEVTADPGYEFKGWYLNNELIDEKTTRISQNSYVYAWFEATDTNKFKVKFECLTGGTFDQSAKTIVEFDKQNVSTWGDIKASAPTPIATTGYTFSGWYLNKGETPLADETQIAETSYVFAYFEETKVNVTIKETDHAQITQPSELLQVSSLNVMREKLEQLVIPEEGYELTGWAINDERIFDDQIINQDIELEPIISQGQFNSYVFNEANKTALVDKKINAQADLMIPSYVFKNGEAYKVTGIKYYDGTGYYMSDSTIKTLCLPNTLTYIADRAFSSTSLTTLYLPKSTTKLAYQCFYRTYSLKTFKFLGTIEEYKSIVKEGWWNDGMSAKVVHCIDGTTNP